MTRDEAQAQMRAINETISKLGTAYQRLSLIAAGTIESPEEIAIQSTKAQAEIDAVDVDIIKGIEKEIEGADANIGK